jgi:hypothetical protein
VYDLVSSDNELYATFHQLVRAEARLPEDNEYDRFRTPVDATMFPGYYDRIRFAALSLDGRWSAPRYGAFAIVVRDESIRDRATVFEENSFHFCRKHVRVGDPVPPGYRAVWSERDRLAAAKLHAKLEVGTIPTEFKDILLKPDRAGKGQDEFIEVHIFGPLHRQGIERVTGPKPKRRADQVKLREMKRMLGEVGADLEIY